jgi:hypothetical protein
MGPPSYMRSVFDRKVFMRLICVHENYRFVRYSVVQKEYVKTSQCVLAQDRHKLCETAFTTVLYLNMFYFIYRRFYFIPLNTLIKIKLNTNSY